MNTPKYGRPRLRWIKPVNMFAIVALLSACANLGPQAIRAGRTDYNVALRQTTDEQLLLNLVRLKYRDTPFFLEASAITTQFAFIPTGGVTATINPGDLDNQYGLSGLFVYEERPTVTYTPLQGEECVQRLLSPVELDTILLLLHSGWSIERVLRVCVQRLNGIPNAPSASGPTPTRVPEFATFLRAVQLLRDLQLVDALSAGYAREGETSKPTVQIAESFRDTPKLRELTDLLGLARGLRSYRLTTDLGKAAPDAIGIGTRSLLGVMFYLSQSVEVPPEDEVAGKVTVTRFASGEAFDWRAVTEGILRVRSSGTSPGNAAVSVHYRNHWFYIDDADLDSKSSFTLLSQLFALQSGRSRGLSPVLTLPLGR